MLTWQGYDLQLPITDIKEENGVITFNVAMEENGTPNPELPEDTGIFSIEADYKGFYNIYNFNGVKIGCGDAEYVNRLPKGSYIINGKKFIIK